MSAYEKLTKVTGAAREAIKTNLRASVEALSDIRARADSWANALTGLATSRDKSTYTLPYLSPVLAPQTLEAIYHDDDIAARIVSALPDECFREGVTVVSKAAAAEINTYMEKARGASRDRIMSTAREIAKRSMGDTLQQRATELQTDLETFGTSEKFRESMTWGRLYGLGAVMMGIDDGRELWEPVDPDNVRGINYLTVLDKRDLTPWRWYNDPQAPKFSDVAIYLVQPVGVFFGLGVGGGNSNSNTPMMLVHESRMIRFGGELTSKRLKLANQGADYSVLQKAFRALQLTNDNWQSVALLLADASQGVLKIKGLIDMIAQQPDIMQDRFAFMDMARSVARAIVLDADGEDFERKPTPFAGIPDVLEHTWTRVSSAARMPKIILMCGAPKGLGDTGDSELRWWYDTVRATQNHAVKPQMERLLYMMAQSRGWDDAEDWSVVFTPLWQLSAKEEADMHAAQANADKIYLDSGVVTPEEMGLSRFGAGKYSLDTKIDVESRKRTMALTLEHMETEADNALEAAKDPAPTPGVASAQQLALATTPGPGSPTVTET